MSDNLPHLPFCEPSKPLVRIYSAEQTRKYGQQCYAAGRAAAIPPGWKLVPVEPTPEMLNATSWPSCARTDYAHMLAAAPAPEDTP